MRARRRDERGVVFPSPVVMLSIVAVAMAAVAFLATRGAEPTEREVVASSGEPSVSPTPSAQTTPKPKPKPKPVVQRGKTYVEVYNNSGITGLAGQVGTRATDAGWQVVGTDNWVGSVNGNTVFYPQRLKAAAELLALDLGIGRTALAVDPMRLDRLTVILTGELS
ncbi:LytR C-terminal domain-containing protein [Nocardioides sp. cx-173]|uniref:LytR C-terminal domain-containing protein n=1 Tax=Nocardioides sp. cx-173 TaxID=2898796 RepID=UPI001E4E9402|nr:LytR C-terminal domain-containing protein [Nocardioides sp. cx-173]MCD4526477.1 LytR C-terminal domain-containing protein [Nocardioides sp. cx-173]UGB41165.1 LytR C-terminal domain-containing protein [Nocardioides sp. cx-173]